MDRGVSSRGVAVASERGDRIAYVLLIPWFIGMLFTLIPFGVSLYLAFTDYDLLTSPNWVGLDNFREFVSDPKAATAARSP